MSVFEFEATTESQTDNSGANPDAEGGGEREKITKTVTVLESDVGEYTTCRATLPADIVDEMDLSGGDVLMMEHEEGSDKIEVTIP